MKRDDIFIIVDFENTLVDTSKYLADMIERSLSDLAKNVDRKTIMKNLHDFDLIIKPLGVNPAQFWENMRKYEDRIGGVKKGTIYTYPDTLDFLRFASDYKLILLTDVEEENTKKMLKMLKLHKYFNVIECAREHIMSFSRFKKPHLHFAKVALEKAGYKKGEIIYVGDSYSDLVLTNNMKKAGLKNTFILVKRYSNIKGDVIVKNLKQAMQKIKKLIK